MEAVQAPPQLPSLRPPPPPPPAICQPASTTDSRTVCCADAQLSPHPERSFTGPGRPANTFGRVLGKKLRLCELYSPVAPSRHMEKMARPLPINPTFLPPTHGVLKSLLENPLKLPFHHDEGKQNLTCMLSGSGLHRRLVVSLPVVVRSTLVGLTGLCSEGHGPT